MADVVPKAVTGEEVGGGQGLEEGVSLDLLRPNMAEARDRSGGPWLAYAFQSRPLCSMSVLRSGLSAAD